MQRDLRVRDEAEGSGEDAGPTGGEATSSPIPFSIGLRGGAMPLTARPGSGGESTASTTLKKNDDGRSGRTRNTKLGVGNRGWAG